MIQSRQVSCCISSFDRSFLEGSLSMALKHKTEFLPTLFEEEGGWEECFLEREKTSPR